MLNVVSSLSTMPLIYVDNNSNNVIFVGHCNNLPPSYFDLWPSCVICTLRFASGANDHTRAINQNRRAANYYNALKNNVIVILQLSISYCNVDHPRSVG